MSRLCCKPVSLLLWYITLQVWPNLLHVWAAYRKTQVTKSRNIKIQKHEFICNLRFCDIIILFGTTCKSNTVRTLATTVAFYNISALCNRNKKQIYKTSEAQRAACVSRAAAWPPCYTLLLSLTELLTALLPPVIILKSLQGLTVMMLRAKVWA